MLDVIRARVVCSSATAMLVLLDQLRHGFKTSRRRDGGPAVHLEVIRCKNKFEQVDPTHFRNVIVNLRMHVPSLKGRAAFVELQVHQRDILVYNDASHAHGHYNYWRALLSAEYDQAAC